MKKYLQTDDWKIIENGFQAELLRHSESIFSLGNGRFGERGNFEEPYSSDSFRASFVAGITYLEKTRIKWWKNGFPPFYSRFPIAANWSRIHVRLIDEELDLALWDVNQFSRCLNMKEGISYRDMEVTSPRGNKLAVHVEHLCDMASPNLCLIKYSVTSVNYSGKLSLVPTLDCSHNDSMEYRDEKVWNILYAGTTNNEAYLWTQTRREDAQVCYAMSYQFFKNSQEIHSNPIRIEKERITGHSLGTDVRPGDRVTLIKYVSIISSLYYERQNLLNCALDEVRNAQKSGWESLVTAHKEAWQEIWKETDVHIEGDPEVQQGIRFNIFQLYQTYRGDDPRLNIGPKGFTGEKYGGNTYWNTELCCMPFFLLSTSKHISQNLLIYRFNQLKKAIENAVKLGFSQGAALFPQVTSNGEECHSEWETTFEEIHRNNIIVYAIMQYAFLVGSYDYVANYGLEVMIAVCRFWSQRVSFSKPKQKYVILGVTGPNEYENNVDNNWYTNYSCIQSLQMTLDAIQKVAQEYPQQFEDLCQKIHFQRNTEEQQWREIINGMYLPEQEGIFIQNDGYLDKVLQPVSDIPAEERPINQHWSWDRILRSCYIKQSDVLLGLYLYNIYFDLDTIRKNFDFYEPMTVHESSLSPYIHSTLAARIGYIDKAYQLLVYATRLDLDDYNNEVKDGLHITSMPGSWLAIVYGLAGLQIKNGIMILSPVKPEKWSSYSFQVSYQNSTIAVVIGRQITVSLIQGHSISIQIRKQVYTIQDNKPVSIPY